MKKEKKQQLKGLLLAATQQRKRKKKVPRACILQIKKQTGSFDCVLSFSPCIVLLSP